ncbi:hypothetical protein I3843_10G101200 [Carya illinoinensis]|nr:hypothetical protein I3843_10G101200 [Carya illinoinensis]
MCGVGWRRKGRHTTTHSAMDSTQHMDSQQQKHNHHSDTSHKKAFGQHTCMTATTHSDHTNSHMQNTSFGQHHSHQLTHAKHFTRTALVEKPSCSKDQHDSWKLTHAAARKSK